MKNFTNFCICPARTAETAWLRAFNSISRFVLVTLSLKTKALQPQHAIRFVTKSSTKVPTHLAINCNAQLKVSKLAHTSYHT